MKAKFFPHSSVLDCEALNKDLYAWKSIIQAKNVIDLGSIWRIRNGQSMKVRVDKWLQQFLASKIISPVSGLPHESRVCDLIDQEEHEWKVDYIEQEFLPHEAQIIKGIPLSIQEIPKKQVWLPLTHGNYTTQIAYKLLALSESNKKRNCSTNRSNSHL